MITTIILMFHRLQTNPFERHFKKLGQIIQKFYSVQMGTQIVAIMVAKPFKAASLCEQEFYSDIIICYGLLHRMLICMNDNKVIKIIPTLKAWLNFNIFIAVAKKKTHHQSKIHKECISQHRGCFQCFQQTPVLQIKQCLSFMMSYEIHFVNSFHIECLHIFINSISCFSGGYSVLG